MRKLCPLATAALLAACGTAPPASDTATEAAADSGSPMIGRYEIVDSEGMKFGALLNADGTYQNVATDGETMEQGTWEARAADRLCFHAEGEAQPVICFTFSEVAADGTQVATPDNGTPPLTVKKVE